MDAIFLAELLTCLIYWPAFEIFLVMVMDICHAIKFVFRFCVWTIEVSVGKSILLEFLHFDLEDHVACDYDSLSIYSGTTFNGM